MNENDAEATIKKLLDVIGAHDRQISRLVEIIAKLSARIDALETVIKKRPESKIMRVGAQFNA